MITEVTGPSRQRRGPDPCPLKFEEPLTIVFAALAVARYVQNETGLSIKKIVRALRPLQQVTVRIAGHDHLAEDPLTPVAEDILAALDLTPQ